MTKAKRIVLLVVNSFTLLGGLAALVLSIGFSSHQDALSPPTPSEQEIRSAEPTWLRKELRRAAESISFLIGSIQDASRILLFSGTVMIVGSVAHFFLTPWRVDRDNK